MPSMTLRRAPHRHDARWPRRASWLRALEIALGTLGVVLLGVAAESKLRASVFQFEQERAFAAASARRIADSGPRQVPAALTEDTPAEPAVAPNILAQIEIARIGVSAMVREGVDDATLAVAVGHIPGTARPGELGNMGLVGHRDSFFRALRHIQLQDAIDVRTQQRIDRYRVESITVVGAKDVSVLDPTADMVLTLVTCYPFTWVGHAPKRFVVRASKERQLG